MKRIIIIGASSGIGLKAAGRYAEMGYRIGMAARHTDPMKQLQARYPDQIEVTGLDVTAPDATRKFEELIQLTGGMDVLLFASGVGFNDTDLNDSILTNTLMVNVVGFARIVAEAYKYFRRTANDTPGHIAVITSVAATNALGSAAAYSASKRFQRQFIDSLRQLAIHQKVNVKFTDIRPGFIRTPLLDPSTDYPMIMSLDEAMPLIINAIEKGKEVATINTRWRIVNALWSLIPTCVWRHLYVGISGDTPKIEASLPTNLPIISNFR